MNEVNDMATLVLCSNHKTHGNYYEGHLNLPMTLHGKHKVSLIYAMIPNTAYTFNGDTFTFKEVAATLTFTLTGSFTATALALYLQLQMIAESLAHGAGQTYTVTYNATTGKITFQDTSGVPANFQIMASTFSKSLAYKLGFNVADTVAATSTTTPNILNLQPPKGCLLELDGLSMSRKIQHTSGGQLGHFFIPVTVDSFAIMDYYHKSMFENEIEVLDEFNNIYYKLIDPETREALKIQSDWIAVLRIQ